MLHAYLRFSMSLPLVWVLKKTTIVNKFWLVLRYALNYQFLFIVFPSWYCHFPPITFLHRLSYVIDSKLICPHFSVPLLRPEYVHASNVNNSLYYYFFTFRLCFRSELHHIFTSLNWVIYIQFIAHFRHLCHFLASFIHFGTSTLIFYWFSIDITVSKVR